MIVRGKRDLTNFSNSKFEADFTATANEHHWNRVICVNNNKLNSSLGCQMATEIRTISHVNCI